MRARGAKATDIAILVVAADDGVMPQTVEAINHAQAADVPIVVAVNKIDKEGADPQKIRSQLTEYGLVAEDFGGDTMFVDISAKNGTNIKALEEAVLLTADAALDLRANPDMEAQGVAIEAHLDRGRGPVATVLIQRGTLRVGDSDRGRRRLRPSPPHGRRARRGRRRGATRRGRFRSSASRRCPVPVTTSWSSTRTASPARSPTGAARASATRWRPRTRKRISLEDLESALKETSQLNLILKGDNAGTVEALEEALLGIQIDDEVELRVIDRGVGGITETNVNLASASDAIIIGFNVRAEGKATELANREGVEIRYYSVIYQAIDEIEKALKGMLKPIYEEKELGRAEIRAIFRSSKVGNIAGCLVQSGIMRRNAKARLLRDNLVVAENLTVSSLKREKDDATEVREGYECGLTLTYGDIKEGDVIETYELVEKARSLASGRPRHGPKRLSKRIATIVASAIEYEIKDPPLAFVTVTDTKVTGDLHDATVYYTVRGNTLDEEPDYAGAAAALERAKGMLRTKVGRGYRRAVHPDAGVRAGQGARHRAEDGGAAGSRPRRRRRRGPDPGGRHSCRRRAAVPCGRRRGNDLWAGAQRPGK